MSVWRSQTITVSYSHPFRMWRVGGCDFVVAALGPTAHHALDLFMRLYLAAHGLSLADDEAFVWIKASVDAPAAKPSGCPRPKAEPRSGLREACLCWSVVLMNDWCQCQEVSLLSISIRQ